MRKNWHKVLSLGLAMVMAFSMAVPAYAAEPPADPLPIQEEIQQEEPEIQDTGEVPGSMETTNEESAPVVPAPTVPEKAPEGEVPKEEAPASDGTDVVTSPDDAVPGGAESSNGDAENSPTNNGPFKVKFLEGSDQYGVIFVDGEEVNIKDFVMELYPTDGVSFCVESSDEQHVASAVDFTGDCKLEAVEGGFVLSEVKSDVDLLVTYEEGVSETNISVLAETLPSILTPSYTLSSEMMINGLTIDIANGDESWRGFSNIQFRIGNGNWAAMDSNWFSTKLIENGQQIIFNKTFLDTLWKQVENTTAEIQFFCNDSKSTVLTYILTLPASGNAPYAPHDVYMTWDMALYNKSTTPDEMGVFMNKEGNYSLYLYIPVYLGSATKFVSRNSEAQNTLARFETLNGQKYVKVPYAVDAYWDRANYPSEIENGIHLEFTMDDPLSTIMEINIHFDASEAKLVRQSTSSSYVKPGGVLYFSDTKTLQVSAYQFNSDIMTAVQSFKDHDVKNIVIETSGTVPEKCFAGFTDVENVFINADASIEADAFYDVGTTSGFQLHLKNGYGSTFYDRAFAHSGLLEMNIDTNVYIGAECFADCCMLKSVNMSKVTYIRPRAFYHCCKLESLEFPALKNIGERAFGECSALESIIAEQCETVSTGAFLNDVNLKTAIFSPSWKPENGIFAGCPLMEENSNNQCSDSINVHFRVYKLRTKQFVDLNTTSLNASEADAALSETYTIPRLSFFMPEGYSYTGFIGLMGSYADGMDHKENDSVQFSMYSDETYITYVVYDYGLENELKEPDFSSPKVSETEIEIGKDSSKSQTNRRILLKLVYPNGDVVNGPYLRLYFTKNGVDSSGRNTYNDCDLPTGADAMDLIEAAFPGLKLPEGYAICGSHANRGMLHVPTELSSYGATHANHACNAWLKSFVGYPGWNYDVYDASVYIVPCMHSVGTEVSFYDGSSCVQSNKLFGDETAAAPELTGDAYMEFLGWSASKNSKKISVLPGELVTASGSNKYYAVWNYMPSDDRYNTANIKYFDTVGHALGTKAVSIQWATDYDLTGSVSQDYVTDKGITYRVISVEGPTSGFCLNDIDIEVYCDLDPEEALDDLTVTYRVYDTTHKTYTNIGTTQVQQSAKGSLVSSEFRLPKITDFGLVEKVHYANCYRVTGPFTNGTNAAKTGTDVSLFMNTDPMITYWVTLYDETQVDLSVPTETDSSDRDERKWWSLVYAGLSSYRYFDATIRYHANYPDGYDPVYEVKASCAVDTRSNNGDDTPADCVYSPSDGNAQVESTLTVPHFSAPAGYRAEAKSCSWTAFHGINGDTRRTFDCYWYTDKEGKTIVGPNVNPTYNKPVIDVYLHWVPIGSTGSTVRFLDGSTTVKEAIYVMPGDNVYVPSTTKANYALKGWSLSKKAVEVDVRPNRIIYPQTSATYYAVWGKENCTVTLSYENEIAKEVVKTNVLPDSYKNGTPYDFSSVAESEFEHDDHHYACRIPETIRGFIDDDMTIVVPCYLDDNHNGVPDEKEITVMIPIVDKDGNLVGELEVTGEKDEPFDLIDVIKDPFIDDDGREWTIKSPEGQYILTENPDPLIAERVPENFTIDLMDENGKKVGEITITAVPGDPYDLTPEIENGFADEDGKEYDIVSPEGGNIIKAGELDHLNVTLVTGSGENPNPGEKDPVPPTALDTIIYEFYKDKPSEIAVPIQMNDAKNLIRLRLGNDKMPEDAYGMADDAIILSPEYLMNVEEGAYRLLPTFDDPAGTTIPNLVVKVYESVADRMDPCLFYKRILFDGTNSALKYYEGKGDAYANDVLALVIDDQMVTPEGVVMDFTDENVSALVSKTPMMFRAVYSLLASDAFSAENGQIMLDGPFVSSMNLAAGDHLVGAVFDNTSRTVDVNKVVLTIPKKTITITLEFKTPDGATIAVKEVSGTQGESYDLNKHIPATITGSDGKTYVPGELADAKGTFSEDGVVEVPCELKEETDPGTDPVKPTGDATLTVKFVNPDGRTVRTFTIAGKDGDAYDVSEQIPALFVGTDGKAYKAEVPEDATGFLKGNKTLIVNCVRKTGSVTPIEPDDDDKTPDKDTDKTPTGSVKPIITTGSSNETTTNRITNNTKTVYLGGSKTGGSVTYHTTAGGSGSKDIGAVKETDENTIAAPEKTETSNTAAAENEKGDAAMEPIYTGQACGCECMTLVIVLLVIMMFTILLFAVWFIITERRRRDDEKREQARLAAEEQNGAVKE